MRKVLLSTLIAALPATMALAEPSEDTAKARIGYFRLVGLEMAGLAAMAQGKVDYDAEAAKIHAGNLVALSQYHMPSLFAEGTSKADLPGVTRAEATIWEDMGDFQQKGAAFHEAILAMDSAAGEGLDALRPAVGQLGGTCKACHDSYRAKDF